MAEDIPSILDNQRAVVTVASTNIIYAVSTPDLSSSSSLLLPHASPGNDSALSSNGLG